MKFLIGMICGLVVAIAVPVAMVASGAAAQREPRSKKSTAQKPTEATDQGL